MNNRVQILITAGAPDGEENALASRILTTSLTSAVELALQAFVECMRERFAAIYPHFSIRCEKQDASGAIITPSETVDEKFLRLLSGNPQLQEVLVRQILDRIAMSDVTASPLPVTTNATDNGILIDIIQKIVDDFGHMKKK